MSGIEGAVPLDDDAPEQGDESVNARTTGKLTVPGNILNWIDDSATRFGVPRDLLAAVVYQHSRFSGLTPTIVGQVAANLSYQHANQSYGDVVGEAGGLRGRATTTSSNIDLWLDAATSFAYGSTTSGAAKAYRSSIERVYGQTHTIENPAWKPSSPDTVARSILGPAPTGITLGTDSKLPTGKFTTASFPGGIGGYAAYGTAGGGATLAAPKIPGLTNDQADAVSAISDSLYLRYLGRYPTTAEYVDISRRGYTPSTLEEHLRAQSFGGTTVGMWQDTKAKANKFAQDQFGRDADQGEVNFLVTNSITDPDSVMAYYEQLRQRRDSGDPAFAWAGDPQTWRDTQSTVESLWKRSGLTGKVDPHFVNQAVDGGWTTDDIQNQINAMPAPGFTEGVTVGEVARIRSVARSYKDSVGSVAQGQPLSNDELKQFVGQSPLAIREYYRSLPWAGRGKVAQPKTQAPAPVPTGDTSGKTYGAKSNPRNLQGISITTPGGQTYRANPQAGTKEQVA